MGNTITQQTESIRKMNSKFYEYRDSVKAFGSDLASPQSTIGYQANKAKNLTELADIKVPVDPNDKKNKETTFKLLTPEGKPFQELLKSADPALQTALNDAFSDVLKLSEQTNNAVSKFQDDCKGINELLKANHLNVSFNGYANKLQGLRAEVMSALKGQHAAEINATKALFDEGAPTRDNLKTLGITEEGLDIFKEQALSALQHSHKQALDSFSKETESDVKKLHDHQATEYARINKLLNAYDKESDIRNNIDSRHNDRRDGILMCGTGKGVRESEKFKDIEVSDYQKFKNNRTTTQYNKETGEYNITIRAPKRGLSPFYYRTQIKKDLDQAALSIRAQGFPSIEMSVNYKDQNAKNDTDVSATAMEIGRKQYEACAKYYPDNKIAIRVNGKIIKNDELFMDQPARKQRADAVYEKAQELLKGPPVVQTQEDRKLDAALEERRRPSMGA